MPLIRKSSERLETKLRIAVFGENGEMPYTDTSGVLHYHDADDTHPYYANTWGEFNNNGFKPSEYIDGHRSTIIMHCYLPENADTSHDGSLFGYATSGQENKYFYVRVSGNSLVYKCGAASEVSKTYTPGWHVFGFLHVKTESAEGVVFVYDNTLVEGSASSPVIHTNPTYIRTQGISVGRAVGMTGASGIKCQKAIVEVYTTATIGYQGHMMHFYPVSVSTPDGTAKTAFWYETRVKQDTATTDGTAAALTASGEPAQYGVCMDDIAEITESGYRDILAILTEDRGVDTKMGFTEATASDPYVTHDKNCAFDMSGVWVIDAKEAGDLLCELILGRKTAFEIWHDSIRYGFVVTENADQSRTLHFQLFRRINTGADYATTPYISKDPDLVDFDGYDNSESSVHRPYVGEVGEDTGYGVVFTNGLPVSCEPADAWMLALQYDPGKTQYTGIPSNSLFIAKQAATGTVKGMIGNAAPWNYSRAQAVAADWTVAGFAVQVKFYDKTLMNAVKMLTAAEQTAIGTPAVLSGDTPAAIRTLYQATEQDAEGQLDVSNLGYLYALLYSTNPQPITGQTGRWTAVINYLTSRMSLLMPSALAHPTAITDSDIMDIDLLRSSAADTSLRGELRFGGRYCITDFSRLAGEICLMNDSFNYFEHAEGDGLPPYGCFKTAIYKWDDGPVSPSAQDRWFCKLEAYYCPDTISVPVPNSGYECGMMISRTYAEQVAEDRTVYPSSSQICYHHYNAATGKEDSGYAGTIGQDLRYFSMFYNEFGGIYHQPVGGDQGLPKNMTVKMTFFEAATAPILSRVKGTQFNGNNKSYYETINEGDIYEDDDSELIGRTFCAGYPSVEHEPTEASSQQELCRFGFAIYKRIEDGGVISYREAGSDWLNLICSYYKQQKSLSTTVVIERHYYKANGSKMELCTQQGELTIGSNPTSWHNFTLDGIGGDSTYLPVRARVLDTQSAREGTWYAPTDNGTPGVTRENMPLAEIQLETMAIGDTASAHRGEYFTLFFADY